MKRAASYKTPDLQVDQTYVYSSRLKENKLLIMKVEWQRQGLQGIQFYLLLSPYLCFISLLYLDLYVLGDDALIS